MGAGRNDRTVEGIYPSSCFRRAAACDLYDFRKLVLVVTGVDPLRTVTAEKALVEAQT